MAAYKEHACAGFVAYLLLLGLLTYGMQMPVTRTVMLCEWLLCTLVGSLFPDIDIKSKGQRLVYSLILLTSLTLILLKKVHCAAYLTTFFLIPVIVRHRGICHELWFACCIAAFVLCTTCYCIPHQLMRCGYDLLFFLCGFISHLILDKRLRIPLRR